MIEITLNFDSCYTDVIPTTATYAGIYVVYAYNGIPETPVWTLLDIGQAENIYLRHLNHERSCYWKQYAATHKMNLVYYTAQINNEHKNRDIAEAALLFRFQPMFSTDGRNGYHHGDVKICVLGRLQAALGTFVQRNTDIQE